MNATLETLGRRFARLATRAVVARPALWRFFRVPLRAQFDGLASSWEGRGGPEMLAPLAAALDRLESSPRTALDVGTGTGRAARFLAERYPECQVVGVDLAPGMISVAREHLPPELEPRLRFEVADASSLPFPDAAFDLVVLLNMIPFFDELARVTAPDGAVVAVAGYGHETPIYTPAQTLRRKLEALGFERVDLVYAGPGEAVLARRRQPG